ncbi:MAG: TspO/MBR family protein [Planctomycetota bacterium]|jgi:tryptophan-rich sensory protein
MKLAIFIRLLACLGVTFSVPFITSVFMTRASVSVWYAGLNKPFFTPPDWLFAPVWTILYFLMGVSVFLVWQRGLERHRVRPAMALYLVQLILNALWTPLFFGLRMPFLALVELVALLTAIVLTLFAFASVSALAAWLLVPYLAWTSFAAILNGAIWWLNR